MGDVLVIEILIIGFLVWIVAEVVAARLPKRVWPYLILRSFVLAWVGYGLFNTGVFGDFKQPPPQTVATLMEQVRGDELHWNDFGKPATQWESYNRRNYKRTCQSYAIKQLGELGPAASEAVPELIQLFKEFEDYNSGDGVYELRSVIARTLGAIGEAEAIEPMMDMLLEKSLSPDQRNNRSAIRWHDREYENFRSYLKQGTGPQAILTGLMLMPQKHHHAIVKNLKIARAKIEESGQFNAWSKFEIDRGILFFEANKKTRRRVRDHISLNGGIDDAAFEKLIAPTYVRPWSTKSRIKLSDGTWSKEIATEEEFKRILAKNRRETRARAGQ